MSFRDRGTPLRSVGRSMSWEEMDSLGLTKAVDEYYKVPYARGHAFTLPCPADSLLIAC
jgi:hypothetical protein